MARAYTLLSTHLKAISTCTALEVDPDVQRIRIGAAIYVTGEISFQPSLRQTTAGNRLSDYQTYCRLPSTLG